MRIMKKIGDKLDNKKAQAAMEYLTTYGWAVLVVLIVVSALFYLGVFSPKSTGSCFVTAPFICRDSIANQNSAGLLLTGKNINSVSIIDFTVNGKKCTDPIASGGMGGQLYTDTSLNYFDDNQQVWVRCVGITNTVGNKITSDVTLSYTKKSSGLQHSILAHSSRTGETGKGIFDLSHVIDSSIVLSYDFEAAQGTNVPSLTGKNGGTTTGVVTFSNTNGKVGYYSNFDGINGFITVTDDPSLNFASSFSIEGWIKPQALLSSGGILNKKNGNSGYEYTLGSGQLYYWLGDGTNRYGPTSLSPAFDNNWHCFTYVYTSPSSITVYLDGTNPQSVNTLSLGAIAPVADLVIGRSSVGLYFRGNLDSIVIYRKVLSTEEVKDHYCYTDYNTNPTLCNS